MSIGGKRYKCQLVVKEVNVNRLSETKVCNMDCQLIAIR